MCHHSVLAIEAAILFIPSGVQEGVLHVVSSIVKEVINRVLTRPFTRCEVEGVPAKCFRLKLGER